MDVVEADSKRVGSLGSEFKALIGFGSRALSEPSGRMTGAPVFPHDDRIGQTNSTA